MLTPFWSSVRLRWLTYPLDAREGQLTARRCIRRDATAAAATEFTPGENDA
jgi:hypothetical protein